MFQGGVSLSVEERLGCDGGGEDGRGVAELNGRMSWSVIVNSDREAEMQ